MDITTPDTKTKLAPITAKGNNLLFRVKTPDAIPNAKPTVLKIPETKKPPKG